MTEIAAPVPPLVGDPEADNTVLTHLVKTILPEYWDQLPTDTMLDLVVSTVAGALAVGAWQLQEFVDYAEEQEELEGLTRLYVPFHPSWKDVAVWLQRSREKRPVTEESVPNQPSS